MLFEITYLQTTYDSAPCGTRTHDPRIRNPLLYPAELRALFYGLVGLVLCWRFRARQGDLKGCKTTCADIWAGGVSGDLTRIPPGPMPVSPVVSVKSPSGIHLLMSQAAVLFPNHGKGEATIVHQVEKGDR